MNINIDQALQKIELSKLAIDEAEKILAELLQTQVSAIGNYMLLFLRCSLRCQF